MKALGLRFIFEKKVEQIILSVRILGEIRIRKPLGAWLLPALLVSGTFNLLQAQTEPNPAQQYYEQAEKALAERRFDLAAEGYGKLAALSPNIAEVHAKLGWIYYQMGRFQDAVPPFRYALELKPNLPNAEVLLAICLSELGRYDESVPILEKVFPEPPDPTLKRIVGLELQRGYLGLKRFNEAAGTALKMIELYPDDAEIIYHTGRLFGDFSFLTMRRLTQVAPESVWTHLAAGEAHEGQKKYDPAIREYRKVLALEPGRAGIHYRIGLIMRYDLQPRSPLAEIQKEFEQELEIDATNASAAYELAELHRLSGRPQPALERYEQAVDLYPDYEEARLGLARALIQLEKYQDALPHLREAAKLNPQSEVPHYLQSQVYRAVGDTEALQKSLAEFERLRLKKLDEETK